MQRRHWLFRVSCVALCDSIHCYCYLGSIPECLTSLYTFEKTTKVFQNWTNFHLKTGQPNQLVLFCHPLPRYFHLICCCLIWINQKLLFQHTRACLWLSMTNWLAFFIYNKCGTYSLLSLVHNKLSIFSWIKWLTYVCIWHF